MTKTTDKDLVEVLEKRNTAGRYDLLIQQARQGLFHDFKTTLGLPKMALVQALDHYPELADIRKDVANGVYDEPSSTIYND
jgi:hypothetical protein